MTTIPGFVIRGRPTTKKTSNRVVRIPKKGAHRCPKCGDMPGFPKVLPSEQYERWEAAAMDQFGPIKAELVRRGVSLPITGLVSVEALIYRERNTGDVAGFIQAIGDVLQEGGIVANDRQIEDWDGTRRAERRRESPRRDLPHGALRGRRSG